MTAPFALAAGRLHLRPMEQSDFDALCAILQDPQVMYAYEHAFSDTEVQDWLDRQRMRYEKDGFGLWAAVRPDTGELIGQCGLTMQPTPLGDVMEVGYLFRRDCWHQGYATECARACMNYGFWALDADAVYSIIRDNNAPSRAVAERNGMQVVGQFTKHYYGVDMPHLIYCARRPAPHKDGGQI